MWGWCVACFILFWRELNDFDAFYGEKCPLCHAMLDAASSRAGDCGSSPQWRKGWLKVWTVNHFSVMVVHCRRSHSDRKPYISHLMCGSLKLYNYGHMPCFFWSKHLIAPPVIAGLTRNLLNRETPCQAMHDGWRVNSTMTVLENKPVQTKWATGSVFLMCIQQ